MTISIKKVTAALFFVFGYLVSFNAFSNSSDCKAVVVLYNHSPYTFKQSVIQYPSIAFGIIAKKECGVLVGNKNAQCTLISATTCDASGPIPTPNTFTVKGSNDSSGYHFKSDKLIGPGERYYAVVECNSPKKSECTVTWEKD